MAKKDFDEYYRQHHENYMTIQSEIDNYMMLVNDHMMSEDDMKQATSVFMPIIEAQKFLDYVMYLLNKPNKNSKKPKYDKQMKKKVGNSQYTADNLNDTTKEAIRQFREETHNESNN